ncbi:MAG: SIR2 family protein [Nitrosomonas sp.]|nr:SIR2 family protein [Nitrosomonas sp.]
MIDPINSLSFSIQANPGVYAVLLGSGISRSAKVPTGWEITIDLVRKLASVSGEQCDPTPVEWYRAKFGREPNYSELLDSLAKTPAERQQLLRGYWEASEAEREEGAKQPTRAHRSIATLAAQGFIRLIITTNFDRLMETALADVGITPTILSSTDQVHGALPLIHTRCCLFKIHGDYFDTRIRNTPEELATYPTEFDALLDRIFDEFGLIVCGWSAEWDEALRKAITRAPSRRFSTYWATRGDLGDAAQQLITQRDAQVLPVKDADTFFQALQQQVQSLEEFSRPHPLSTDAAVASLKRYLSEPKYRIQLADLVNGEIERVVESTTGDNFELQGQSAPNNTQAITSRVRAYEAACETLLSMAPIAGLWAEESHFHLWQNALAQLSVRRGEAGYKVWVELQRYPATLLLYALGLGAVEGGHLKFLGKLFSTTVHRENSVDLPAVQLLPAFAVIGTVESAKLLEGMERRYAPLNDWLHDLLKRYLKRLINNDNRFTFAFDKLEILMALSYAHYAQRAKDRYWTLPGAYGYRHDNTERILNEINESLTNEGEHSPYVTSRIFGDSVESCTAGLVAFREFVKKVSSSWY